jgi:hypothetical protein
LFDNLSHLNIDNFLLDVLSMLHNCGFGLSESIDSLLAFFDVLINGKREPIEILSTSIHLLLKNFDVSLH